MSSAKYSYSIQDDFPNHLVATDRLMQEIQQSAITTALDYINTSGDDCDIWFKATLSENDQATLSSLVATHSGEPLTPSGTSLDNSDKIIGVVSGKGFTSWVPSDANYSRENVDGFIQDCARNLITRAQVLTDEESFRDDFTSGSLSKALTGTATFTNGSDIVSGVGTKFLEEAKLSLYLKLSTDDESHLMTIYNVQSDELLHLDSPYTGSSGSGTASASRWATHIATGGTITQADSEAQILSGTTEGSCTHLLRYGDYLPMVIGFSGRISQRIAEQAAFVGLMDDEFCCAQTQSVVIFDGTDNTKVKLQTSWSDEDVEVTTVSLPGGLTTDQTIYYQMEISPNKVVLSINEVVACEHKLHIPGPYSSIDCYLGIKNEGTPASSTTLALDTFFLTNFDQIQVGSVMKNDQLPVRIVEDVHTLTAVSSTTSTEADQVLLSYEVPSGKAMYVVGYSISNGETSVRGNPVKIGRNSIGTEPPGPDGGIDSNIFRAASLAAGSIWMEDFSANPRRLGNSQDTILVSVTPTGQLKTTWRVSLDFVLR